MYNEVDFILGEEKYVEFSVRSDRKNDVVIVENATFELFKYLTDYRNEYTNRKKSIQTDSCVVDGDVIKAFISPETSGRYELVVTASIPPETIKHKVLINCKE